MIEMDYSYKAFETKVSYPNLGLSIRVDFLPAHQPVNIGSHKCFLLSWALNLGLIRLFF